MQLELSDEVIADWYRGWFQDNYGQVCGRVNPSTVAAIRDGIKRFCPATGAAGPDSCSTGTCPTGTCPV